MNFLTGGKGKYGVSRRHSSESSHEQNEMSNNNNVNNNNIRRSSGQTGNHQLQRHSTVEADSVKPYANVPTFVTTSDVSHSSPSLLHVSDENPPPLPPRRPRPQINLDRSQSFSPRTRSVLFNNTQLTNISDLRAFLSAGQLNDTSTSMPSSNWIENRMDNNGMSIITYGSRRGNPANVNNANQNFNLWPSDRNFNDRTHFMPNPQFNDLPPSYEEAMRMRTTRNNEDEGILTDNA